MPAAETARAVTGYERGTITPSEHCTGGPSDSRVQGTISIGADAHGVSAINTLSATVADVPAPQALTGF